MNKRSVLICIIGLILVLSNVGILLGQNITSRTTCTVKPERLRSGDKIGLVASASFITEKDLQTSVEKIRQLGFIPVYSDKIHGKYGYFSGTDEQRAADFNDMVKNPDIKGIIFAGGGYGCTRILDLVDYNMIKKNPKVIMGFSDNTALINAINKKTGLVTFHGPIARTIHKGYNQEHFENIIVSPIDKYVIESSAEDLLKSANNKTLDRYTITAGKAQGELVGGNLTLICSMIGTPYQIDMKGKIVMIEDINEEPYRIDRMLTQLIASGELTKAAGIVFGICRGCDKSDKTKTLNSFTLRQVIEDRIKPLNIPAVYGLSFGHNINNFTFPIGLKARFDANNMTIQLFEKAVE
ncbi:LD-carboxypeptidase [Dysgonomonas sp. 216]|uniref:S66 peptidase family protein n=1 Tax=Dysgonomonas sp. 216 TaxID=2302934 RepID=UPI0013D55441|nr:LD-carboxypeptidase [Dysgonomonas sp. 216]NDW19684.1 LD-carboxypeptidase [Dysgonomonas sp. 216]